MTQPDIEKMSVTELKALGYELIGLLEQTQNNLRIVNQKITQMQMQKPIVEPKEEVKV